VCDKLDCGDMPKIGTQYLYISRLETPYTGERTSAPRFFQIATPLPLLAGNENDGLGMGCARSRARHAHKAKALPDKQDSVPLPFIRATDSMTDVPKGG